LNLLPVNYELTALTDRLHFLNYYKPLFIRIPPIFFLPFSICPAFMATCSAAGLLANLLSLRRNPALL